MSGQIINQNGKLSSTYAPVPDMMGTLIDDFYNASYSFAKSAGAARYGYDAVNAGYFNAIMGKEMTAAMFSCDNVFTALGSRPYDHEGVRIVTEQAYYGQFDTKLMNEAQQNALRKVDGMPYAEGDFVGLGATTIQDGEVPNSVQMPVKEYRQPYKDLPFRFDYGMGLQALENKDDTTTKRDYMVKMSENYSDLVDKSLLRPLSAGQSTYGGVETGLNSIARVISSADEVGGSENSVTITDDYTAPYGGRAGDFYINGKNSTSPVRDYNLDGKLVNVGGGVLSLNDMDKLWRECSVNWKNGSPNGKMWAMGNIAQQKLAALMKANNVYLDSVYVSKDFNGVRTIPGRDAGFIMNSYLNIPIVQDANISFDFSKKAASAAKYGDIFLLDLDNIWMSMLTPLEVFTVYNPSITQNLQERNVMTMRAELRADRFIGSGRIINIADDA